MDITLRKQTDEALRRTEKLAAAGRLAATIAHEVNNPLEAVTNLIFLARNEPNQPERNRLLEMADRNYSRSVISRDRRSVYRDSRERRESTSASGERVLDVFRATEIKECKRTSRLAVTRLFSGAGRIPRWCQTSSAMPSMRRPVRASTSASDKAATAPSCGFDHGSGILRQPKRWSSNLFTTKKDVGTDLVLISRRIVESHGGSIHFPAATGRGRRLPGPCLWSACETCRWPGKQPGRKARR